jgi:hypothetical protein
MSGKISGKLGKAGCVVMETHSISLSVPKELRSEFHEHPEGHLKKVLEQNGEKVNGILIARPAKGKASAAPRAKRKPHMYHIVYPENERSIWIYVGDMP